MSADLGELKHARVVHIELARNRLHQVASATHRNELKATAKHFQLIYSAQYVVAAQRTTDVKMILKIFDCLHGDAFTTAACARSRQPLTQLIERHHTCTYEWFYKSSAGEACIAPPLIWLVDRHTSMICTASS